MKQISATGRYNVRLQNIIGNSGKKLSRKREKEEEKVVMLSLQK